MQPSSLLDRTQVSSDVPQPGALRHQLGSPGSRDVVLRHGASIFVAEKAVSRGTDRQPPTGAGEADLDDLGNHQGTTARAPGGATERCGESGLRTHLHGQTE